MEDRDLLRELRKGQAAALRQIYLKYKDDLLTLAACLLGERTAAEDVLHDVFVALAANSPNLHPKSNLKGYLINAAANRARDELRRRARQAAPTEKIPEVTVASTNPAKLMADREESDRILKALALLPFEQREVITLHLQGEMTFKQIARQQNESINTVQSRYRYGLDKLRKLLTEGAKT